MNVGELHWGEAVIASERRVWEFQVLLRARETAEAAMDGKQVIACVCVC